VGQESGSQPDRPKKVGRNGDLGRVGFAGGQTLGPHDARIVEKDVQRWEVGRSFVRKRLYGCWVVDIQLLSFHARVCVHDCFELGYVASGDQNLVALFMKGLGEGDAAATASNENSIPASRCTSFDGGVPISRAGWARVPYASKDVPNPPEAVEKVYCFR
jgi:hypothetical protein